MADRRDGGRNSDRLAAKLPPVLVDARRSYRAISRELGLRKNAAAAGSACACAAGRRVTNPNAYDATARFMTGETFVMLFATGRSVHRSSAEGKQRDEPTRRASGHRDRDFPRCSSGDWGLSGSGAAAGVQPASTRLQCRAEIFDALAREAGAGGDLDDRLPLAQQFHRLDNLRRQWRLPSLVPVFPQVVIVPHIVRRGLGLAFGGGDLIGQRWRVQQCQRRFTPGLGAAEIGGSALRSGSVSTPSS